MTDQTKENEVAKFIHISIGRIIHKILVADDKPASDFTIILAAFAGQLTAVSSSVDVLCKAGFLTAPLAKNLDAAVEGISRQLFQGIKQSADEQFEDKGHCGRKGCKACDAREAKRVKVMH